mmetsp:Transcript_16372/g.29361  ORF Transcript_16372/g.29361 Transcript_16372/m.29361 type:complete len:300 (-) Transcript_16372:333-1232(-)
MGIRVHASNFISQFFSHDESSFINTDTIHDGVRPCKVNVFKDARGWGCIFHTGSYVTLSSVHVDKERFSSLDVTDQLESQCVNCYRLTGNAIIQFLISCLLHTFRRPLFPFICWICGPASKDQGSDTMRIPKSYQSDAVDQIHGGVSSFALLHEICARGKDSLNNTLFVAIGSTFMFGQELGKAIQQQLGIGISVDVTLFFCHFLVQSIRVGQVPIVRHADPMRVVGIQGLCFGARTASCRGISNMAESHISTKFRHVMLLKDVSHHSIVFSQMQSHPFCRHHSGSVLTAVLENGESIK